jgi:subtilisin-like proprotein convertase family protein
VGNVYHAQISPAGDNDWIQFNANQNDLITVGTDADGTPTVDTFIHLMRSDCTTQLASDDDSGPGTFSLISNFPAPYTGTYHVRVRGFSATGTGRYKLVATVTQPPDTFCPIDTYKSFDFTQTVTIPDNNPAGVTVGTIVVPDDGTTIGDLVVDLGISHTWAGDIIARLTHTPPVGPAVSVDLIARPGVPATTVGCSGDLVGTAANRYFFGTGNLAVLGESSCPAQIPVQCYRVAPENANGLLPFRGTAKAGQWTLFVSDNAALDTGLVHGFSIHVLNEGPVGVEASSWGSIKATYR